MYITKDINEYIRRIIIKTSNYGIIKDNEPLLDLHQIISEFSLKSDNLEIELPVDLFYVSKVARDNEGMTEICEKVLNFMSKCHLSGYVWKKNKWYYSRQ